MKTISCKFRHDIILNSSYVSVLTALNKLLESDLSRIIKNKQLLLLSLYNKGQHRTALIVCWVGLARVDSFQMKSEQNKVWTCAFFKVTSYEEKTLKSSCFNHIIILYFKTHCAPIHFIYPLYMQGHRGAGVHLQQLLRERQEMSGKL